ncbi:hypothetical protein OS493_035703 [Desmophyllum pertusum]|uniref:Uncharacterized protein n=1 Tax=Desmophyllum pertusum TaxID=174260 RepID=A0A9W9YIB8_9CNID|nr:hypothetical protein OS493_035703 [Desmophyllum pertusum]
MMAFNSGEDASSPRKRQRSRDNKNGAAVPTHSSLWHRNETDDQAVNEEYCRARIQCIYKSIVNQTTVQQTFW